MMYKTVDKVDFVAWLNGQIVARGISRAEFARAIGVSAPHVTRILSGEQSPGSDVLVGIARALGKPPEEIFRRAVGLPPVPAADPLADEARYIVANLPPETREMPISYLRFLAERDRR